MFSAERVDHATGGEEEEGFEEGVRHEMEDGGGVGANSAGHEHIAELGNGGIGEDALDVVLDYADCGGEQSGCCTDNRYDHEGRGGAVEEDVATGDHVDAGGNHRGCVDESGDGGGALHRVG